MRRAAVAIAGSVFLLDRLSKMLVERAVPLFESVQVAPFFRIAHYSNRDAAFGLLSEVPAPVKNQILITFSIVALAVTLRLLWRPLLNPPRSMPALALILGGALGNLWDRVANGAVTDFLELYIGRHVWPDFNLADSAIVVGALLIILETLRSSPPIVESEHA